MVTQTTVTSVSLGYIMHPSEVGEGYLQPVYIFEGDDRIGNTEESFGSVMIDAKEG
jgi:hypothetical protein